MRKVTLLDRYVKHAELYGTDEVFEAAIEQLNPVDLGRLSLRLQNLDDTWRPRGLDVNEFAIELLVWGETPKQAARMTMLSMSTIRKLQREGMPKKAPAAPRKPAAKKPSTFNPERDLVKREL